MENEQQVSSMLRGLDVETDIPVEGTVTGVIHLIFVMLPKS